MAKCIYFVGKPYPKAFGLDVFKGDDYKVGVILDKNVRLKNKDRYDNVVEIDFSSEQAILAGLAGRNLEADGLVCTYENYILAKSQIASVLKLPSPSIHSAEISTDKYQMRQAFLKADPTITPNFGTAESEDEAIRISSRLAYPLIIKPTNLVKSLLVLKCADHAELLKNFKYAQGAIAALYEKHRVYGRRPRLIIEEFVEGKACSIAAFVDSSGQPHFCEGIVSLVNAQDLNIADNYIYGRFLPGEFDKGLKKRLFDTARKGIAALQMSSTPAHVELIYNDKEVKLIEIGARIGGYRPRMYSMSYGLDLLAQEVKLALGEQPDLSSRPKAHCAVFELFPETEGRFKGIAGSIDKTKLSYYSLKAKPGKLIGPAKNGYKAAAVIIVSNKDKRIFSQICEAVNSLKVEVE
jgi:biotin carboxylase